MVLALNFMENYCWCIVGSFNASGKKCHADMVLPFLKLSRGAHDSVSCGWFHEVVVELKTPTGKRLFLQDTTWKDEK